MIWCEPVDHCPRATPFPGMRGAMIVVGSEDVATAGRLAITVHKGNLGRETGCGSTIALEQHGDLSAIRADDAINLLVRTSISAPAQRESIRRQENDPQHDFFLKPLPVARQRRALDLPAPKAQSKLDPGSPAFAGAGEPGVTGREPRFAIPRVQGNHFPAGWRAEPSLPEALPLPFPPFPK